MHNTYFPMWLINGLVTERFTHYAKKFKIITFKPFTGKRVPWAPSPMPRSPTGAPTPMLGPPPLGAPTPMPGANVIKIFYVCN
jgi:hypothetical protein